MRSKDKIKAEVAKLREIKPKVIRKSRFGYDNWKALEAQVVVLGESLNEKQIWSIWPSNKPDGYELLSALEALEWMNGESEIDSLAQGWKSLLTS